MPDVIVDRMPVDVTDLGMDAYVTAQPLVGIELYRSEVLRPAEFITQRNCGLIVLWMVYGRRRRGRKLDRAAAVVLR